MFSTDIDTAQLQEYWWMSQAYKVRKYDRMLWATDKYYKEFKDIVDPRTGYPVPRVNIYKALDILLQQNEQ